MDRSIEVLVPTVSEPEAKRSFDAVCEFIQAARLSERDAGTLVDNFFRLLSAHVIETRAFPVTGKASPCSVPLAAFTTDRLAQREHALSVLTELAATRRVSFDELWKAYYRFVSVIAFCACSAEKPFLVATRKVTDDLKERCSAVLLPG